MDWEEDRVPRSPYVYYDEYVIVSPEFYRRIEALSIVVGLVRVGRHVFGPPPKPLPDPAGDPPLGGDVVKQPGDGKPNVTKEEQRANNTDAEEANNEIARTQGLPGLNEIARRNTEGEG